MKNNFLKMFVTSGMTVGCLFLFVKKPLVYEIKPGTAEEVSIPQVNIDEAKKVVTDAIAKGEIPGAAVYVAKKGIVVIDEGFGNAVVDPEIIPTKPTTMYDLASLTKPIAGAASVMMLVQMGKIKLSDRVNKYIPEFNTKGKYKDKIKIEHLLYHVSGLPSWDRYFVKFKDQVVPEKVVADICNKPIKTEPGTKWEYSDLGYLMLGELVRRVSGQTLDEFSREHIYKPLGMNRTMFNPPEEMKKECAATEIMDGKMLWGTVHDGNAAVMGGISGHAGLYSTVEDLGILMQMFLNGGKYGGKQILRYDLVQKMMVPNKKYDGARVGWGEGSAKNKSPKAVGHIGWTGTWIAADPEKDLVVVVLTNRIHPKMKETEAAHRKGISSLGNNVFNAITKQ